MTDTTTHPATNEVVDAYLQQLADGALGTTDLLHADVAFDATVPHWRFHLDGADAVRAELGRWFVGPQQLSDLRRLPTADGEVIDYGLAWSEAGGRWGGHQMAILTVVDGRVAHLAVSCGGRWDPGCWHRWPPPPMLADVPGSSRGCPWDRSRSSWPALPGASRSVATTASPAPCSSGS